MVIFTTILDSSLIICCILGITFNDLCSILGWIATFIYLVEAIAFWANTESLSDSIFGSVIAGILIPSQFGIILGLLIFDLSYIGSLFLSVLFGLVLLEIYKNFRRLINRKKKSN